ncbi:unnamed protein product, partial [Brenthis ino]
MPFRSVGSAPYLLPPQTTSSGPIDRDSPIILPNKIFTLGLVRNGSAHCTAPTSSSTRASTNKQTVQRIQLASLQPGPAADEADGA